VAVTPRVLGDTNSGTVVHAKIDVAHGVAPDGNEPDTGVALGRNTHDPGAVWRKKPDPSFRNRPRVTFAKGLRNGL